MNVLQKFIDETFDMRTGLGEMKVAEAIFLQAVDFASQTFAHSSYKNDRISLKKIMSLAYKGQNIIKMCVHLPRNSNAGKYAYDLSQVAHEIDILVFSLDDAKDRNFMSGYPRRTTLTRLCPEDYEMKEGIAVLNDEVVSAINNPSVVQLLEHDISLLTLFGTSECRLNKQIKSLAYALDETKNRLTDKLEKELTEWNSLAYDAKEVRLRAIKQIDFHEILKADVTLKRYTLYLTTQISELMTTE